MVQAQPAGDRALMGILVACEGLHNLVYRTRASVIPMLLGSWLATERYQMGLMG